MTDEMAKVFVCLVRGECPIYCKVELDMYRIDDSVCVSRENCPFQKAKTLRIRHLPK